MASDENSPRPAAKRARWSNEVIDPQSLQEMKRQAVLRAAARAFNERGFHQTSLDDIAGQLNVSKPALYNYVKSKDDILFECKRIGLERTQRAVEMAEELGGSGLDKLCTFLRLYTEHIFDDFGKCLVLVSNVVLKPETQKELRDGERYLDAKLRAFVEQGMADGSIRVTDAKLATFFIFGAFNWMCRWFREGGEYSAAEIVEQFLHMVKRGIAA
ncbi:MAG TPA: TetR/AcrR family transcriptional regulator [Azospirillaceae bacterium]|nr:TetR/AcrR family transcriptional regulator [Azospirillaceae bacterium]